MNLSAPRPEGQSLPSTRAQAEGLKVHPEPRLLIPPLKAGLRAVERVKKFLRIMEGLAINIGSMVLGYLMIYLFYFFFGSPNISYRYL